MRLKYSPKGTKDKDDITWSFPHTGVTITDAARTSNSGTGGGVGATLLGSLRPVVLVGKGVCYDTGGKFNTRLNNLSFSIKFAFRFFQIGSLELNICHKNIAWCC